MDAGARVDWPSCEPYNYTACYVSIWIWRLVPIPLCVIGTFGNVLNLAILFRRRMRQFSTNVYLIGLALSDILTLWTAILPEAIEEINGYQVRSFCTFCCQSLRFVSYLVGGYSIWLIVLMTVERTILTVSPIAARTSLSVKNAVIAASLCLLVFVLFCGHLFALEVKILEREYGDVNQTVLANVSTCVPIDGYEEFFIHTWPLFLITALVMGPFVLIAIGNGIIITSLVMQKRRLRKINPSGTGSSMSAYNSRRSATNTLLLISAMFFITLVPKATTNVIFPPDVVDEPDFEALKTLIRALTHQLLTCNYTFNFVIYFISGTMFKQELKALMREINNGLRNMVGMEAVSETRTSTKAEASVTQVKKGQTVLVTTDTKPGVSKTAESDADKQL